MIITTVFNRGAVRSAVRNTLIIFLANINE